MAKNVIIRGVTYENVPSVNIPLSQGSGNATFTDTSDANISGGGDLRNGKTAYDASGTKITGSMTEKAAATYTPGTSDQTIAANQYLAGAQTIEGDADLVASNIIDGVTIFGVVGNVKVPVISQDSTTKVLTIS